MANASAAIVVLLAITFLLNGIAISNNNEGTNRNNVSTRIDAFDPNSFRLNYTSENNIKSNSVEDDHPILEYTCGESVRPVPMVSGCDSFREAVNDHLSNNHSTHLFVLSSPSTNAQNVSSQLPPCRHPQTPPPYPTYT